MEDTLAPSASDRKASSSRPTDKFLLRFGLVTLACALLLYVDHEFDAIRIFKSYHLLLALFSTTAVATYIVAALLISIFTLRWNLLLSCLIGPLFVGLAFYYISEARITVGYLHFLQQRGALLSQASELSDAAQQPCVWP